MQSALVYLATQDAPKYHQKIAKKAFRTSHTRISSEDYSEFMGDLNMLADEGILVERQRRYGLAPDARLAKVTLSELFSVADEPEETQDVQLAEEYVEEAITLSGLEKAILEFASQNDTISIRQLKKAIPELAIKGEYTWAQFKRQFPAHRENIAQYMTDKGYVSGWDESGTGAGTKYSLSLIDERSNDSTK